MALNGIDISNWQSGINLAVVPCDFVVIKATEGTGYVNPDYERAYRQAKTAGKCLGIYHYASGGNIQAEAEYFLKNAIIQSCYRIYIHCLFLSILSPYSFFVLFYSRTTALWTASFASLPQENSVHKI